MRLSDNGIPQHRQLYEILKDHIVNDIYKPGDLLPSEKSLCASHGVTRPTVRQALNSLVIDGYIKKQQGKGSIVQPRRQGIGILSLLGTTDSLPPGTLTTRVVEKPYVTSWIHDFDFEVTQQEEESGCIRMSRQRLVNGKPLLYEITNLPNINLPRFCMRSFENKSLFGILTKYYDLRVSGGEQKIWSIEADAEIAKLIGAAEGQPILHLQKKYDTSRPYYHFYTSIWCNTQDYFLMGTF